MAAVISVPLDLLLVTKAGETHGITERMTIREIYLMVIN